MEYDPASPTDEPELPVEAKYNNEQDLDLSTIPLPGPPVAVKSSRMFDTSVCDIPLPPASVDAASIPLPPSSTKIDADLPLENQKNESDIVRLMPFESDNLSDISSGPLKFTLKVTSKHLSGQDMPSEASGVFESSKDSKTDEPRPMPKLQALMKRSKPSQLPVGVLPSKTKLPATETKTELFLPTKEIEVTTASSALAEATKVIQTLSGFSATTTNTSHTRFSAESAEPSTTNEGTNHSQPHQLAKLNQTSLHDTAISSHSFSSSTESHSNSLLGMSAPLHLSNLTTNTTFGSVPVTTIPNLMSLTVQPVQTLVTAPTAAMLPDPTLVLRQSKMNMANMQYVNPQKLRSAQMIATPLIANPALAAQSHQLSEQAKDNRKRSRSRSRRRSGSRHRSGQRYRSHRRHSSSSTDGSPKYSSRRRERRSRSRKSSEEKRSREHTYQRDRDRRGTERRREKTSENEMKHSQHDNKQSRDTERYAGSKTLKEDSRSRRRSRSRDPPMKDKPKREREDTKPDKRVRDRSKDKNVRSRDSPKSRDPRIDRTSPRLNTSRRSENPKGRDAQSRSSQLEQSSKRSRHDSEKITEKSSSRSSAASKQDARHQKPKIQPHRSESESSASSRSASPKKSKIEVSSKRIVEQPTVRKHVASDNESDTDCSSSSSCKSNKSSPKIKPKEAHRQKSSQGDKEDFSKSKSLSTRESELLSASLHSKNAGIGLNCEIDSHPVTPDDDGVGAAMSAESECDSMDISSDSETLDADAVKTPNDKDMATLESNLQIVCTQLEESVLEILASGTGQEIVQPPVECVKNISIVGHLKSDKAECTAMSQFTDNKLAVAENVQQSVGAPRALEFKYDLRARKSKRKTDPLLQSGGCLTPVQPSWFRSNDTSINVFDTFPDAPKPNYVHIVDNDYSAVDANDTCVAPSKQFNLTSASLLGSAGLTSNVTHREMRRWVCDCAAPTVEELDLGLFSCGLGCINRALNIECGSLCPAGQFCSNRQFQGRFYAPTEPFYSGSGKGWGLRAAEDIPKHTFIIEYVGEVINFAEFRRRVRRYEKLGHAHHYFMALESDRFIDAGSKGNWARFVNHSCEPNCVTQKWSVDGRIRIGFFAKEPIKAGDEITIDYQFVQFGASEQKCYCGTPSCSGIMGATSKHLQDKIRLKDTTMVERRVIQLLQCQSFQSAEDITLLLQVMVQECLTRYTRLELLKRLANTETGECLKLFRQYNGLDMLAAFMCDSDLTDWELKRQILICLDNIPVSEQKQVQTNSRLMEIVTQWTVDPRFCRPRGSGSCSDSATPVSPSHHIDRMRDSPCSRVSADICQSKAESCSENENSTLQKSNQPPTITTLPADVSELHHTHPDAVLSGDLIVETTSTSNVPSMHIPSPKNATTSCVSSPVSLQSSNPDRRITRSASASAGGSWCQNDENCQQFAEKPFDDTSVPLGSTSLVVDVETGELEPSLSSSERNEPDVEQHIHVSEDVLIAEIQRLSRHLVEKWSKLPKENYRIPRVEREETEKLLHASSQMDSSLVSWGHGEDHEVATSSWSHGNERGSASHRLRTLSNPPSTLSSTERCADRLSKLERRKLFEAQVIAAESKKVDNTLDDEQSPDRTEAQEADRLRQLLLRTLLDELRKASTSSTVTETANSGANSGIKGDNTVVLMNTLIQTLPHILSKITNSENTSAITRLCEEMTRQLKHSENSLPSGWQSAVDPSGKTYYYNMETKVVQWEKPTAPDGTAEISVTDNVRTSSPNPATMDAETRKRLRKEFTIEVGNYVLKLLRPYRLPNCVTGRIESDGDLVHITRKLTHAFISKELDRSTKKHVPCLNQALQDRIRSSLTRYMMSHGTVYKRRKRTTQTEQKTVDEKGGDNHVAPPHGP